MERNYNRSTMNHIADVHCGVRLDTGVVTCLARMTSASHNPFNIFGRVRINHLFIEAITIWGAQAGTVLFNHDAIDPATAVKPLSGACASVVGQLAEGLRIVFVGGAVATAAVITATAGISDVICESPHVVGTKGGYGYVGYQNTGAAVTSGTMQVTICYAPMDEGSYMTANW